ncbi:hypothetical protein SAMN05421809_1604 [Natronorubrum daqingense]|uniref:Uncharacterized protein n=1 Tax=Natronorubrum daqingense TaxID=588898 RepID=A0A1N7CAN8_9EURY|nr:hypothetical protein BB347_09400 [Natronorubrum daqingense]SIR60679.1 hypothetical protein SAMN05421809_1604 [Natronorubrum daqingense]
MDFCNQCGVLLIPDADSDQCTDCDSENGSPTISRQAEAVGTDLEQLRSTKSGTIRKRNAEKWLRNCDRPSSTEFKRSILPKPAGFEGSTYETDISNIRVTGDAQFVETVAGLLKSILDLENDETRVELNLQRTRVRDTKQYTGNYALYLSVAERGGQ